MAFPDSFRAARWLRTLNLVLQAVLILTFFGGLNYVARNHSWRFDLTKHRKFSLSPETLSYVKNLQRPVEIVATLTEEEDTPEIRGLLQEFVQAAESNRAGRITTAYIDVYQDRRKAETYGIGEANAFLVRSGDKSRTILVAELYRMKDKQRAAFQGEQVLTAAMLDVSNTEHDHVYFIVGHSELHPTDTDPGRGLSALRDQLRVRNFSVDTLELSVARRIPADASVLVAVAPQTAYTRAEQEMLREYLRVNAGRLILFLGHGKPVSALGLDDLLLDWGVLADDDVVIDLAPESVAENQDLIVRAHAKEHPIGLAMHEQQLSFRFGPTRTIRVDPGRPMTTGLSVVPISATSEQAWGETRYTRGPYTKDAADIRPMRGIIPEDRLSVVVASERVSVRDNLPFSVPGGRLVVFGTADSVSNHRIGYYGNFPGFLAAVNWAVDRDKQLAIPPRPIERFQLALSANQFMQLRYALMLGLPGATLLLGMIVYWTRRR